MSGSDWTEDMKRYGQKADGRRGSGVAVILAWTIHAVYIYIYIYIRICRILQGGLYDMYTSVTMTMFFDS